jgi:hypothetical protein
VFLQLFGIVAMTSSFVGEDDSVTRLALTIDRNSCGTDDDKAVGQMSTATNKEIRKLQFRFQSPANRRPVVNPGPLFASR